MTLYDTTVDPSVVNSSHSIVVQLVGRDRRVLDVGCSTGYVARALVDVGCTVSGIEFNEAAAEIARPVLEKLVVADLNSTPLDGAFAGQQFDAVVMADILEHLADPVDVLRTASTLLSEDGEVVISVPNVAHGSLRLALLQGRWRYRDTGLLDKTHIHFYTVETLHALLEEAGLVATEIQSVVLDPLGVEVEIDVDALPEGVVDWVRGDAGAHAYQFVVRARRRSSDDDGSRPEPVPAVPVDEAAKHAASYRARAARHERDREIAESVEDLRHKVLVARDNAIGLETAASRARTESVMIRRELEQAQRELAETHRELAETRQDVVLTHARLRAALDDAAAVRRSRTWLLSQRLTAPVRRLRGGSR